MSENKINDLINSLGYSQIFTVCYILNSFKTLCQLKPNKYFTIEEIYNSILWRPIETPYDNSFQLEHLKIVFDKLNYFDFVDKNKEGKLTYKDYFNYSMLIEYHINNGCNFK